MKKIPFIKNNKVGFILGGILGAIMPLIFFILWGLGLHSDTYSIFPDSIFLMGYMLTKNILPPMQVGIFSIRLIIGLILNFIYLGLIGAYIQKLIKSKFSRK